MKDKFQKKVIKQQKQLIAATNISNAIGVFNIANSDIMLTLSLGNEVSSDQIRVFEETRDRVYDMMMVDSKQSLKDKIFSTPKKRLCELDDKAFCDDCMSEDWKQCELNAEDELSEREQQIVKSSAEVMKENIIKQKDLKPTENVTYDVDDDPEENPCLNCENHSCEGCPNDAKWPYGSLGMPKGYPYGFPISHDMCKTCTNTICVEHYTTKTERKKIQTVKKPGTK